MRPEGVVFPAVVLDDHAGFGERPELLTVEAFVTEASVEALHIAVLPRAAGFDVDRLDPVSLLIRRGIQGPQKKEVHRNGLRVVTRSQDASPVTLEIVNQIKDEG